MAAEINILAICGSTKSTSSNLLLLQAMKELLPANVVVTLFNGLADLPHFNPELDNAQVSNTVTAFRRQLRAADGILICTPEYALGVPGTVKNAFDWTVSSMELSQKTVALVTASLRGEKAHESLLGTLLLLGATMTTDTQLLISFIKSKVNRDGCITDEETLSKILHLLKSFTELIANRGAITAKMMLELNK
jgi:chromate reductase